MAHIKTHIGQPVVDPVREKQVEDEEVFRKQEAHDAALTVVTRVQDKEHAKTILQALGLLE